jgi:hypothetical protein
VVVSKNKRFIQILRMTGIPWQRGGINTKLVIMVTPEKLGEQTVLQLGVCIRQQDNVQASSNGIAGYWRLKHGLGC